MYGELFSSLVGLQIGGADLAVRRIAMYPAVLGMPQAGAMCCYGSAAAVDRVPVGLSGCDVHGRRRRPFGGEQQFGFQFGDREEGAVAGAVG